MYKWIIILSTTLLSTIFVGCDEHSLGGDEPPKEDVYINFSVGPSFDYTIEEVSRASKELISIGLLGVAKNESDSLSDCLTRLVDSYFCHNMYNAEFQGLFPGIVLPVDGMPRSFPLEEGSAVAIYGYMPYKKDAMCIGDTSCYIKLDLLQEGMSKDYMYTGMSFEDKASYRDRQNAKIDLHFKHAFSKINILFTAELTEELNEETVVVDTLELGFKNNGKGLLDLKNGFFYPQKTVNDTIYNFELTDIDCIIEHGVFKASKTLFIPPSMTPEHIKVVLSVVETEEKIRRILAFDDDFNIKMGKEYTISLKYNTQKNVSLHRD